MEEPAASFPNAPALESEKAPESAPAWRLVEDTPLDGVKVIASKKQDDELGVSFETYNSQAFSAAGVDLRFVEDSQSLLARAGTLRGLHFQAAPFAQDKLLRAVRGVALAVAVDLRSASPSYGRHVAVTLSAENGRQLLIPIGFAHGFCTVEPNTAVLCKATNYHSPEHDKGLAWDDPALGIVWPVAADRVLVADRDRGHPKLGDLPAIF